MKDQILAAPDDSEEDTAMLAWLSEPVLYEGLIVQRRAAFQLCAAQEQCWRFLDRINDLPRAEVPPGAIILSAGGAYGILSAASQQLALQEMYANPGRDV